MNSESPDNQTGNTKSSKFDVAQLTALIQPLGRFIKQHLVILFITLTLSALIYAVLAVNSVLQETGISQEAPDATYSTSFDRTTTAKIDILNDNSQTPTITLPGGRINPFAE